MNKKYALLTGISVLSLLLGGCYKNAKTYSVTWYDYDGTELAKVIGVLEDTTPKYNGKEPTRADEGGYRYTWTGWDPEITPIHKNQEYTATYSKSAIEYSITYNLNGGTNSEYNVNKYTVEQEVTLYDPAKPGYTFLGWFDSNEQQVNKIVKGTTGNITLNASWSEANKFTVQLDPNGGSVSDRSVSVTYDALYQLPTPTRDGYTFLGWFEGNYQIPTSGTWTYLTNKNVTAHWEVINYSITYNLDGGTNNENNPSSYTVEDEITLLDASKEGYTFLGWLDANEKKVEKIAKGTTGNITLSASFKENEPEISEITSKALSLFEALQIEVTLPDFTSLDEEVFNYDIDLEGTNYGYPYVDAYLEDNHMEDIATILTGWETFVNEESETVYLSSDGLVQIRAKYYDYMGGFTHLVFYSTSALPNYGNEPYDPTPGPGPQPTSKWPATEIAQELADLGYTSTIPEYAGDIDGDVYCDAYTSYLMINFALPNDITEAEAGLLYSSIVSNSGYRLEKYDGSTDRYLFTNDEVDLLFYGVYGYFFIKVTGAAGDYTGFPTAALNQYFADNNLPELTADKIEYSMSVNTGFNNIIVTGYYANADAASSMLTTYKGLVGEQGYTLYSNYQGTLTYYKGSIGVDLKVDGAKLIVDVYDWTIM